jgi:hypothetical protein
MPDFSKELSNKIQVWFKRGYNHNIKVQFIEDPLLRTQVDPKSWCIQDPGKISKGFSKQSEEIDPLIKQYFYKDFVHCEQLNSFSPV